VRVRIEPAERKVLVVGGGPAGASLAIRLRNHGIEVEIAEIEPEWGVVGLGISWRLAGRASVAGFDRGKAGAGASHAAAGMLAACCEAEPGEEALVALGRQSQACWPGFAEELARTSGVDVELRTEGTLVLALTADDQGELAHRLEFRRDRRP